MRFALTLPTPTGTARGRGNGEEREITGRREGPRQGNLLWI
jgi:hypothetical protein